MASENIPWAVLDGITSASLARMLAYQATGGEEGVAGLGDLLVRQTAVASGNVRVAPGGGIMVNRYPGVQNESYMARAGDETLVAVAPNASGATRYDLLVYYIDDWNFAGQQATPGTLPTNSVPVAKFKVISGVPASTKRARDLNLAYPAIALALIAIPAGTSAVTQAMITSLREKAVPRRKRDLRPLSLTGANTDTLDATTAYPGGGESWPNNLMTVEIPYWASELKIIGSWNSVLFAPGGCKGGVWVRVGHGRADVQNTQISAYDSTTSAAGDYAREVISVADTVKIPATMRGQSVQIGLWGNVSAGTPANRVAKLDSASSIHIDMEFVEAATEDV